MKLKGRIAIVTGAAVGLGRAIAAQFADEGATVVVADVDEKEGRACEAFIKSGNDRADSTACFYLVDVSRETSVKRMVDAVVDSYGRIDILVNNAGIIYRKLLSQHTLEEWDHVLRVDLTGVFLCTKEVVPHMIKQKKGKIINISSAAGQIGYPYPSYCAAKAGVINLTRGLVFELAPKGININCICPGVIETSINKGVRDNQDLWAKAIKKIPQKRVGNPEDISRAALFLASDDSDYVNGAALTIDGGLTAVSSLFEEQA